MTVTINSQITVKQSYIFLGFFTGPNNIRNSCSIKNLIRNPVTNINACTGAVNYSSAVIEGHVYLGTKTHTSTSIRSTVDGNITGKSEISV
ncbi:hypothetical protein ACU5Z1_005244 [Escherichia coli]